MKRRISGLFVSLVPVILAFAIMNNNGIPVSGHKENGWIVYVETRG